MNANSFLKETTWQQTQTLFIVIQIWSSLDLIGDAKGNKDINVCVAVKQKRIDDS